MSSEAPKPDPPAKPRNAAVPHIWRQELRELSPPLAGSAAPEARAAPRRRKVFRVLCVMLGMMGAIVGLLSWLRPLPQPTFFPIWVASYQSFLMPVPSQSRRDRTALWEGNYFPRTNADAYVNQELSFLNNELAALANLSGSEAVVVYLSAFATGSVMQEDGKNTADVMVLPGDMLPDVAATRLPLRRVLEALRDCPARRKLLILDIMRPLAQLGEPGVPPGRLGTLADDIACRIDFELDAVPDANRLVLFACSPGQSSLSSEVMGRSVFNYYVEAGLRGGADGFGPDATRWGRIDVLELANFVRLRVDQWAWQNRGLRQTPLLRGSGDSFQLTGLDHGEPEAPPPLRDAQTYPPWMLKDFQLLDQWRHSGDHRLRPRTYRQLEALLLREEQNWRGGMDSVSVENLRKPYLDNLVKQLDEARQEVLHPDPRSLALAIAQGRQPDAKLVEAVQALLVQVKTQTAGMPPDKAQPVLAKLADDFQKKQKGADIFNLSYAVFAAAGGETRPAPEIIRLLDGLLQARTPVPLYIETLCLKNLADLAQAGGDWPAATVHLYLQIVEQGERAASQFRVFPWLRGQLDEADQLRFAAEYLFWARGYAPMEEADKLFRQAQDRYTQLLAIEDNLLQALRTRDEALALLPACIPYLDLSRHDAKGWFDAIEAAIELTETLKPDPDNPPGGVRLRQLSDTWRQKSDNLRGFLDPLRRRFSNESQAVLIKNAQEPKTRVSAVGEIDAVLSTTLLAAPERVNLWKAAIQASRELVDLSLQADQDPAQSKLNPVLPDLDFQHLEREERQRADLRARMAAALFRLGGLAAEHIKLIEDARAASLKKGDAESLDVLAAAIQHAWAVKLPAQLAAETDPYARVRLSWIFPPFDSNRLLDDAATNPTLQMEIAQSRSLWGWLAESYRRRGRDLPGAGLYTEVAREYQALVGRPADSPASLRIAAASPLPRLTPAQPTGSLAVQLTLPAAMKEQDGVEFSVISPAGDWLTILPEIEGAAQNPQGPWPVNFDSKQARTIWLRLALQPGAESAGLGPMQGFIVAARMAGRTEFQKISLAVLPLGNRPEIVLSASAASPDPPLGNIRLRTVKSPQPIFVYVRNPTDKPYAFNAELLASDNTLLGSAVKVGLMPREVKRVAFTPALLPAPAPAPGSPPLPAAPPAKDLPELRGPLQIRLVDAASPSNVFDVRQVEVDIALPREYVQVASIVFDPADFANARPNQLQAKLRAIANLGGPPCPIELVLPPGRIPGLLAVKEGTFRGELPPPGADLTLFARNLTFNEGSPREGTVYFNVDGYERAFLFRTSFVRQGDAVSPQQDYRPALRLKADRYAQANARYEVTLEVDNAPTGATLDLALGLNVGDAFQAELTKTFPEARRRRIGFKPDGPGGALLFDASISDWALPLDTSLILGPRLLRARLLDAAGAEIQVVTQEVTLVNSGPGNVQIIQAPKQAVKGAPITIQAMGFDSQSGIQQVQFFFGKPAEGQLPPKTPTIPAAPIADDPNIFAAQVPIPETAAGPTEISVQFTNKAGLSSFATATIQVVDKLEPQLGRITGRLIEGNRPQANLEVTLKDPSPMAAKDPKMGVIMKTTTAADGSFTFENVKPGSYLLIAVKEVANRKAEAPVVVKPGETAKVTLELFF